MRLLLKINQLHLLKINKYICVHTQYKILLLLLFKKLIELLLFKDFLKNV